MSASWTSIRGYSRSASHLVVNKVIDGNADWLRHPARSIFSVYSIEDKRQERIFPGAFHS